MEKKIGLLGKKKEQKNGERHRETEKTLEKILENTLTKKTADGESSRTP